MPASSSRWVVCRGWDQARSSNLDRCPNVWAGTFLDDEVDGRFTEADGKARLASLRDQRRAATPDKPIFNNFTGMVVQQWYADSFGEGYVNDYQDATSDRHLLRHRHRLRLRRRRDLVAICHGGAGRPVALP